MFILIICFYDENEAIYEEFPPIVCECSDAFPKDLPYLSFIRDVQFTIDLD